MMIIISNINEIISNILTNNTAYIILIVIILPIIGTLNVGLIDTNKSIYSIPKVGLYYSTFTFIISIIIWVNFEQIVENYYNFTSAQTSQIQMYIGIDGINLYYVILTTFITPITIICANYKGIKNIQIYVSIILLLEGLLCFVFTVQDILLFYIFFESVLIPLFIIVNIFGAVSKIELKYRASFIMFLYTLIGSLFMLLGIVLIYYYTGTTNMTIIKYSYIDISQQKILFWFFIISMAVKTPLIPFNTWLTYAHAEAPVGGSIILAGVILKLATYGYLRIVLPIFSDATIYYIPVIQIISSITLLYASIVTIRQTDFKRLVAYSSVAHMAIVVLGIFSNTYEGLVGAYLLSLSHGLVSPALFYLLGGVLYDRYHTRIIKYYRGITTYIPIFTTIFFVFSLSNCGVPLTGNWLGEFITISGVFITNPFCAFIASFSIVISAIYSIGLFTKICFGIWSPNLVYNWTKFTYYIIINNVKNIANSQSQNNIKIYQNVKSVDIIRVEIFVIFPLFIFTIMLGITPNIVVDNITIDIVKLLYNMQNILYNIPLVLSLIFIISIKFNK